MTGEVTLRGAVLPIGGLKQKVLAAHRAGITEMVVPARNEIDLDEVPAGIREAITFHVVSTVPEVLAVALGRRLGRVLNRAWIDKTICNSKEVLH